MLVIQSPTEMQNQSEAWRTQGMRIGFVPTMGNLHDGHLSLVEKARADTDKVVVSIFVNPLQFNESRDFELYPRTLQADFDRLSPYGVDVVFTPDEAGFYPRGRRNMTAVDVPVITDELEGAHRPGHFRGVTTVVAKFFHIIQPTSAFFGEKDFQQLLVVRRMVEDLCMPVDVVGLATRREPDGLAMSSRNGRLLQEQRLLAPQLYKTLQQVRAEILTGVVDYAGLEQQAMGILLASGFQPEYVAIRNSCDLATAKPGDPLVILGAVNCGEVRLIDNLRV